MKSKHLFSSLIFIIFISYNLKSQIGFPDPGFQLNSLFHENDNVDNYAFDVDIQHDSKIVIVGSQKNNTSRDIIVIRLHENGLPDYSFQGNAFQLYNITSSKKECARSVKVVDKKILVAGCSGNSAFLLRLNEDGSRDPSFGSDGIRICSSLSVINEIAIEKLGDHYNILAAGTYRDGTTNKAGIIKYSSTGEADHSFGDLGLAKIDLNLESEFTDIKISVAGAVYACGNILKKGLHDNDALIAKFNLKGRSNKLFGGGLAYVTVDAPIERRNNGARSLFIDKNKKVTICGSYESVKDYDAYVCRVNENGSLDRNFGSKRDGYYRSDYVNETDESTSLVVQNDGRIIIGGRSDFEGNFDFTLTRLNPNGLPDTSFACNSWQMSDFSSGNDEINAMFLIEDKYLITVGNSINTKQDKIVLAKYKVSNSKDLRSEDLAKIW